MDDVTPLSLSGTRFEAVYRLTGDAKKASEMAQDICVEQTVEFPLKLIQRDDILEQVLGEVQTLTEIEPNLFEVCIGYPVETAGSELTQLMNVLFGNTSLKPGVRLVSFTLPKVLLDQFRGPRFGCTGIRERLDVWDRPLLCAAIKPMGLSSRALAEIAYGFAKGGVDFIKDDHGLADQSFCRYEERVQMVSDAVNRANQKTGSHCLYVPNVTGPFQDVMERVRYARSCEAGGLLIAPGLVGFDTMRAVADDDNIGLPVFSHPAMLGSMTVHADSGIAPGALFGTLMRLAGADAVIFPHFGGRFSFTPKACQELTVKAKEPMAHVRDIFPCPGGGMHLDRLSDMKAFYGNSVIFLVGGDIHGHGEDLVENAKIFMREITL